jgi:hypothetical protein
MIKVDSTQHSTVVVCTDCPGGKVGLSWSIAAMSHYAGLRTAGVHEEQVHPTSYRARNALRMYEEAEPSVARRFDTPPRRTAA